MSRLRFLLLIVIASLFPLLLSMNVHAAQGTIITEVPLPKETVMIPEGYAHCFTVEAGWYQNTWIPRHQICQYEKITQGVAWIEGYWRCTKFTAIGVCETWDWIKGHWQKTLAVY